MILLKLAWKNVRSQFRHYFIYLACMIFVVMVYYSFVAMSDSRQLAARSDNDIRIAVALQAASVLIIGFIVMFMFSANNFFIKKRRREIGLYNLLGIRRSQISLLFFLENLVIGFVALAAGIVLGILFSKFFSMILMKMMYLDTQSGFAISLQSIKDTGTVFLTTLILVSLKSAVTIYRYKLITLFRKGREDGQPVRMTAVNWLLGSAGLLLIGGGYYLAANFELLTRLMSQRYPVVYGSINYGVVILLPLVILVSCVIGTYLFFRHFLVIALHILSRLKWFYYRDMNMVAVSNLSTELRKSANTFATIAVLCGTTIAAIGGATAVQSLSMEFVTLIEPSDFSVTSSHYSELKDVIRSFPAHPIQQEAQLTFRYAGGIYDVTQGSTAAAETSLLGFLSLSDYRSLQAFNPYLTDITLSQAEDAVVFTGTADAMVFENQTFGEKVQLEGSLPQLRLTDTRPGDLGTMGGIRLNTMMLVVSDALFEQLPARHEQQVHLINIGQSSQAEALYQAVKDELGDMLQKEQYVQARVTLEAGSVKTRMSVTPEYVPATGSELYSSAGLAMRFPLLSENRSMTGLLIYTAVFLGIVFMVAAGSMIMLKQLSAAEDEKPRYQLLKKLGVPRTTIRRSIFKQQLLIFFLPYLLSLCHAYFALVVLFQIITRPSSLTLTYLSISLLTVTYIVFYAMTSSAYEKIIYE